MLRRHVFSLRSLNKNIFHLYTSGGFIFFFFSRNKQKYKRFVFAIYQGAGFHGKHAGQEKHLVWFMWFMWDVKLCILVCLDPDDDEVVSPLSTFLPPKRSWIWVLFPPGFSVFLSFFSAELQSPDLRTCCHKRELRTCLWIFMITS